MFFDLVATTKIGAKLQHFLEIHKKSSNFADKSFIFSHFQGRWTRRPFGKKQKPASY